ncbi:hypothetical protein I5F05_04910 [Proteus mirabilis]|nr:hypothetical protein [Proteus mirabilis]
MRLSERQVRTLRNVKLNYAPLCNKITLLSLEKKGLIQWHLSNRWVLTELGLAAFNRR